MDGLHMGRIIGRDQVRPRDKASLHQSHSFAIHATYIQSPKGLPCSTWPGCFWNYSTEIGFVDLNLQTLA